MNPAKLKRIASLFREMAEAFDDLAEQPARKPVLAGPGKREAEEAIERVRDELRRKGIHVA